MDELDNLAVRVARRFLTRSEVEGEKILVEHENSRAFSDLVALARELLARKAADSRHMSSEWRSNCTTGWMAH
jgi:hypothetical protein